MFRTRTSRLRCLGAAPHAPQCHLLQLPRNGIPVKQLSSADAVEFPPPQQHSVPEGSPRTETYGLECWMQFSKYADYFICYSSFVSPNVLSCLPSLFPDEVSTSYTQLEPSLSLQADDNVGNVKG
jgi:hypothetical protein